MVILRLFAGLLWAAGALMSWVMYDDPDFLLPIILFWIGSIWMLLRGLRSRPVSRQRADDDFVVEVVAPRRDTRADPSLDSLPEHCRRLFGDRP